MSSKTPDCQLSVMSAWVRHDTMALTTPSFTTPTLSSTYISQST